MGTFSFVAAEGASFSKEKTIKKEEKNGWPFFVAVELGARGGRPLSRSNQGPRHPTTDIHHM